MARTLDDALLAFYRVTERNDGIPPTVREVQDEMGMASTSNGVYWLRNLELAGLIYTPGALLTDGERGPRTLQLSAAGRARAHLLAVASLAQNIRQSEGWAS